MNSNWQALAGQLLSLPPEVRLYLGELLVESVGGFVGQEIELAWREEATRRVEEYETGRVVGISTEAFLAEARKRIDEIRHSSSPGER